jgi:hypothetical protein
LKWQRIGNEIPLLLEEELRAIYFVQVERLNNTGKTTINTMMTPINAIPSVDPACDVESAEAIVVGVRLAVAMLLNP